MEKRLSPSFWVVFNFNWYVFVLVYVCHCICNWYVIVLVLVIVFVIVIIIIRPKHSLEDGGANWGDFEQLSWAASPTSLPTTSSQTFLWRSCTIKTLILLFGWVVLMDAYSCILHCSLEDGYYCIVILSVCHVQLLLMNIFRLLQSPLELGSFSLHRHLFDWFFAKCSSWRYPDLKFVATVTTAGRVKFFSNCVNFSWKQRVSSKICV